VAPFADNTTHSGTRDQVLVVTSEFRNGVEALCANLGDAAGLQLLHRASRTLTDVGRQSNLTPLLDSARILERLAALTETLKPRLPDDTLSILSNVHDTLGTIEQLLDWCIDGAAPERLTPLLAQLTRAYPERYRRLLDSDVDTFTRQLRSLTSSVAAAPGAPAAAQPAVSAELIAAFEAEAEERFGHCDELLVQLEREEDVDELLHALFREFHTLKGAAAEVGLEHAHRQLHEGESLLAALRDGTAAVERRALVDFLLRLLDSVRGLVDRAGGRTASQHAVLTDVVKDIARLTGVTVEPSGEAAAANPTEAQLNSELSDVERNLSEHLQELANLRAKIAAGEQGPEVMQLIETIDRQARQYSHMATGLQDQVDKIRLTPLETVFRRLMRPVRDAARKEGKQVDLKVAGGDIKIEREAAERLHAPLLHLVRNAVSHGIEAPQTREEAGKRRTGTVRINVRRQGQFLLISVDDDGAGLDFETIFEKADGKGWIDPSQLPTRQELARFILRPGFSTLSEATELAGRGVGMDVVAREIEEGMQGRIDIESLDGQGTSFRLSLPLHSLGLGDRQLQAERPGGTER
jgi:two-component system chemotaxis sensor kinase CheA